MIPTILEKIIQSKLHSILVFSVQDQKIFIYTEPNVGRNLESYQLKTKPIRPSSHHLIQGIFLGFNIQPLKVLLYDVQNSIYFSKIFLQKQDNGIKSIIEIDARPSDCISLAVLYDLPIFCSQSLLEKQINISH